MAATSSSSASSREAAGTATADAGPARFRHSCAVVPSHDPREVPGCPQRSQDRRSSGGVDYVGVLPRDGGPGGWPSSPTLGASAAVDHRLLRALARAAAIEQDRAPARSHRSAQGRCQREILVFRIGQDKTVVRESARRHDRARAYGERGCRPAGRALAVARPRRAGLGGELTAPWSPCGAATPLRTTAGPAMRSWGALRAVTEGDRGGRPPGAGATGTAAWPTAAARQVPGGRSATSQDVAGTRTDASTGRTFYVQRLARGRCRSAPGRGDGSAPTASAAVTYTRWAPGRSDGDDDRQLPDLARLPPATWRPALDAHGRGRTYVEETHLDLTEPESLRLAAPS
jgi:hypothetical protein